MCYKRFRKLTMVFSILLIFSLTLFGCTQADDDKPVGNDIETGNDVVSNEGEDEYPTRPINIVVPASPGGSTDLSARCISAHSYEIGETMMVRNMPGGGMSIGIQHVVDAEPDGYTLLNATPFGFTLVPLSMPGDVQYTYEDVIPIAEYAYIPYAIGINAKLADELGIEDWEDALAIIKENPGEYTFGHASITCSFWTLLLADAGYEFREVLQDGGGASASACAGGHVDFYGGSVGAVKGVHEEGLVKVLITFPGEHLEGVPSSEAYPETFEILGLSQYNTCSLYAPKGTPDYIVEQISDAVGRMVEDEGFVTMIEKAGYPVKFTPHEEFKENFIAGYKQVEPYADVLGGYGN